MEKRYLKNPTEVEEAFRFGGVVITVKAGKTIGLDSDIVKFYKSSVNGLLIEVPAPAKKKVKKSKKKGVKK